MKFSFKIAIIYSTFYFAFAQYGNYEFEVYEQDPISGALRPVMNNKIQTTTKRYSNADFEVYEYDPHSGALKPVSTPNRPTVNRQPQSTTRSYQNNVFLNPNTNQNVDSNANLPTMSLSMGSCDNYWALKRDFNGIFGQLTIPSPNTQKAVIRVTLTIATVLQTRYVGDISLAKDRQSTVNDVANGLPILYRVRFPVQNPIPKLTEIYYNNQLLCRGPKAVGEIVTTIALDHTLYTGLAQQNFQNNPNLFTTPPTQSAVIPTEPATTQAPLPITRATRPPVTRPTTTDEPYIFPDVNTSKKPQASSSGERIGEFDSHCGVPQIRLQNSTGLILSGKVAMKGQFPWLAAYYHNDIGNTGFICGGSLVSSKVVLTAAHCIHDKQDQVVKQPEQALIYLGKYFLHSQSNERDFLVSGVTKFIIHPDWSSVTESFDSDIAAVVLLRTIQFTNFIQPICIWSSTHSYSDMINQQGIVAGYGKTEFTITASDKPYWTELPVVDERSCLESNSVFIKITSRRTFCAGNRDGRGPCNGDSGGGFIMKSNNKWYLRGIVSAALFDKEMYMCDTKNYAVFTDVAIFKDWILTQMEVYG
ncbi:hypothetical protein ACKWTF_007887 [Chironomus riparius]